MTALPPATRSGPGGPRPDPAALGRRRAGRPAGGPRLDPAGAAAMSDFPPIAQLVPHEPPMLAPRR